MVHRGRRPPRRAYADVGSGGVCARPPTAMRETPARASDARKSLHAPSGRLRGSIYGVLSGGLGHVHCDAHIFVHRDPASHVERIACDHAVGCGWSCVSIYAPIIVVVRFLVRGLPHPSHRVTLPAIRRPETPRAALGRAVACCFPSFGLRAGFVGQPVRDEALHQVDVCATASEIRPLQALGLSRLALHPEVVTNQLPVARWFQPTLPGVDGPFKSRTRDLGRRRKRQRPRISSKSRQDEAGNVDVVAARATRGLLPGPVGGGGRPPGRIAKRPALSGVALGKVLLLIMLRSLRPYGFGFVHVCVQEFTYCQRGQYCSYTATSCLTRDMDRHG